MKILFWNTNRKELYANLSRLADRPGADVVILAENPSAPGTMEQELGQISGTSFRHLPAPACRVSFYCAPSVQSPKVVFASERFALFRFTDQARGSVLVTGVHLPSKLRYSCSTQTRVAADLAEEIRRQERKSRTSLTVVIGDFNMNPFDAGLIQADALHAVCSRQVASEGGRAVNGRQYPMFFNPCWSLMGDGIAVRAPGTFHRRTTDNDCIFFHTLDQVLFRTGLVPTLPPDGVRILTEDGVESFRSDRDIPRKKSISDHLPILVQLQL